MEKNDCKTVTSTGFNPPYIVGGQLNLNFCRENYRKNIFTGRQENIKYFI